MKPLPLSRIAAWVNGRLHGDDVTIDAVSIDTRSLQAEGRRVLFIALAGERFDGHDHVAQAQQAGACAALVSRIDAHVAIPQLLVADTERALAAIARAMQQTRHGKVIALTGSNGKTSVKAMLLSILAQTEAGKQGRTYANPGNRNNQIGLPLAVIDAPDDAVLCVYEMGAGQPGDIRYLTDVVRPDVALVNNIAPAHLERMGSLLGIADTKAAIYDALDHDGVAVINADDAFAPYFAERAHGHRILRFGIEASADVKAHDIRIDGEHTRFTLATAAGDADIALALPGRHNVRNALAAATCALAAGVSLEAIAAGLRAAQPVQGRAITHALRNGVQLIDDSYNANPGSLGAAIDMLAMQPGTHWLVLGDMRELGIDAEALHAEAGRRAKAAGIARLFAFGPLSMHAAAAFGEGAAHFATHAALAEALRKDLQPDVRVLVKGSRGSAMDRVVDALLQQESAHAA